MATSGQTLNDRINAARYALAGQGLARCVCKATTEEVIGPKKKHLDYLLACTHEPNVSIPQLANLLIERTNHIQWVVVFKALVTVHHLMSYGNERFIQYLASSNYSFELSTFLDKTSARDFSMSTFIRRYSRYINEKALSYRLLAFDFCKIKRGNEGVLRLMPIDRLLKTLPILQNQLDALLEFDCSASDLNNGVINACFMLLFRDLIGLFACHNDGIINLLNKYFTLNKKMCREAFDLYKKFLVRMDKVSDFLRVAEVVGIDKDEIPDLRRAPSSLIDALEQHLLNLEAKKGAALKQANVSGSNQNKSGGELSLGSVTPPGGGGSSMGRSSSPANPGKLSAISGASSAADELALSNFKDDEVRRALEEEARVLSLYGSGEAGKPAKSSPGQLRSNQQQRDDGSSLKFAVTTTPKTIDDLFGDSDSFAANNNNTSNSNSNSNGFRNNSAFESSNSSGGGAATSTKQQQHAKPDINSIKTAIQSATSALEKVNSSNHTSDSKSGSNATVKKASDDLFSLLDTSSSGATLTSQATGAGASNLLDSNQATNPISPFATSSTSFDLPPPAASNGHKSNQFGAAMMKPGNPFPEVSSSFAASFSTSATAPAPIAPTQSTATANSIFKPTGANYTSLGGLEGFGDVLQPMSASGKANSSNLMGGGAGHSSGAKSSFASAGGLTSTGLFKGDLDSTLANLAQNLTFEGMSKPKK